MSSVSFPPEWDPEVQEATDTSLVSAEFKRTLVLDRIFLLLADMIGVIQSLAATQAARLTKLTSWQRAYTDLLTRLKPFTADTKYTGVRTVHTNKISGIASLDTPLALNTQVTTIKADAVITLSRGEADTRNKLNAAWTEQIRARRQVITDEAKVLQSNISQSVDAVSQQANMATALIQQLSTLLAAIYR